MPGNLTTREMRQYSKFDNVQLLLCLHDKDALRCFGTFTFLNLQGSSTAIIFTTLNMYHQPTESIIVFYLKSFSEMKLFSGC